MVGSSKHRWIGINCGHCGAWCADHEHWLKHYQWHVDTKTLAFENFNPVSE